MPIKKLEKLIYSSGHYKKKSQVLKHVSSDLIKRFKGKVPDTEEELLSIKGIGRKTANIVLGFAFDKLVLPIDTHCHRIPNRLGLIKTKNPEQTEIEILGEREEKTKLNKKHIKTLYAICKYKNTAKASKMIGQTIQTTTKHIKEIKKTTLKTKYYEKLEEQEAIELTTKKGNFFSIKDDTREFGINMLQGWLTIKEETELIIPINEAKTKIDFTNPIKHNYLIEE